MDRGLFQTAFCKVGKQYGHHPSCKWKQKIRRVKYHLSDQKYNYYSAWNFQQKKRSICIKRYDNLGNASPDVFIVINTSLQFLMLYNFLMFVTTLRGIEERQALIVNLHMLYCRCNGMSTFNRIVIPVNYADSDMHLSLLKLIVLFGQLVASQYVVSFSLRLSMLRARKWQEKESLHTKQAPLAQPHSRLKKEKSR